MPSVTSVWTRYRTERNQEGGGLYLFLLRPFGNMPYYVGKTDTFSNRLREHEKLYSKGLRTFFRRAFVEEADDKSHSGFVRRWEAVKSDEAVQKSQLFVPEKDPTPSMAEEGLAYWNHSVEILVWPFASGSQRLESFESRVRSDLKQYYDELAGHKVDLKVPGGTSPILGRNESGLLDAPDIRYTLDRGEAMEASEFFHALEKLQFPYV
jgi:predicted GIY-YIG superfamily endonuclease